MALMQLLDIPPLGVSEQEAQVRFAALQRKLVPLWEGDQDQRIRPANEDAPQDFPVNVVKLHASAFRQGGKSLRQIQRQYDLASVRLRDKAESQIHVGAQIVDVTDTGDFRDLDFDISPREPRRPATAPDPQGPTLDKASIIHHDGTMTFVPQCPDFG